MEHYHGNNIVSQSRPGTFFQRLGNWLNRLWAAIKSLFGFGGKEAEKVNTIENPDSMKQLHENLDRELEHNKTSLILPEVEQDFLLSIRFMADAGFSDGIDGIQNARNNEITIIARSRAERLHKLAQSILGGRSTKAETEEREKKELYERSKERNNEGHRQLELLDYYRRHHSKSFSIVWSVLCLGCGLWLSVADFPLAKMLLENGFNLKGWESTWMAIGVSVCTIFIKIYYDNYVDARFGNGLLINAKFEEMFKSVTRQTSTPSEIPVIAQQNKAEWKRRKYWHTGILIFTLLGIIIISMFRVEAIDFSKSTRVPYWLYLATFTFLTLVFPVISGICLSIGLSVAQNILSYWRTVLICWISDRSYLRRLADFTTIQKHQKDISNELSKWNQTEFIDTYKDILLSYYDRGYKLGAVNPGILSGDKDFFGIIQEWHRKASSRKTNNHIVNISGL